MYEMPFCWIVYYLNPFLICSFVTKNTVSEIHVAQYYWLLGLEDFGNVGHYMNFYKTRKTLDMRIQHVNELPHEDNIPCHTQIKPRC